MRRNSENEKYHLGDKGGRFTKYMKAVHKIREESQALLAQASEVKIRSPSSASMAKAASSFQAESASIRGTNRTTAEARDVELKHSKDDGGAVRALSGRYPPDTPQERLGRNVHGGQMRNANVTPKQEQAVPDDSDASKEDVAECGDEPVLDIDEWLLTKALDTVSAEPKRTFNNGDVAIILDMSDLYTLKLIPSLVLTNASTVLEREVEGDLGEVTSYHPLEVNDIPRMDVSYLFVLRHQIPGEPVPRLKREQLDHIVELQEIKVEDEASAEPASQPAPSAATHQVEKEPTPGARKDRIHQQLAKRKYVAAYDSLFRILSNMPQNGLAKKSIEAALPQIEALVDVADLYECTPSLKSSLESLFFHFIHKQQLWYSIARDAGRWLLLATKLQNGMLYEEAMTHVVGRYSTWPWSVPADKLPREVLRTVERKARELKCLRCETNCALTQNTFRIQGRIVSMTHNPVAYMVVNEWRSWLTRGLAHIDGDAQSSAATAPEAHAVDAACEEKITLAGLYRAIARGGDAYLPIEQLARDWDTKRFPYDEQGVRKSLAELKKHASGLVKLLLRCNLQYAEAHMLDYLTCVKVEREDRPWKTEGEDEGEGEGEDMDMDKVKDEGMDMEE